MLLFALLLSACLEAPSKTDATDKPTGFQAAAVPRTPTGSLTVTVTGKAGPVAGAAVWLGDTGEKVAPVARALTLDGAHLTPTLNVLPPGSAISVHNVEGRARTVHLVSAAAAADAPPLAVRDLLGGATAGIPLSGTGVLRLICGPDPCPDAALVVGVGGITDVHGQVAIADIPVGPVRVHVWHATAGEADATSAVAANANANLSLSLP